MKIHPAGAKLFLWTDMMKLIVTFHNFANVPKMEVGTIAITQK
jgi:hypothetical protein